MESQLRTKNKSARRRRNAPAVVELAQVVSEHVFLLVLLDVGSALPEQVVLVECPLEHLFRM